MSNDDAEITFSGTANEWVCSIISFKATARILVIDSEMPSHEDAVQNNPLSISFTNTAGTLLVVQAQIHIRLGHRPGRHGHSAGRGIGRAARGRARAAPDQPKGFGTVEKWRGGERRQGEGCRERWLHKWTCWLVDRVGTQSASEPKGGTRVQELRGRRNDRAAGISAVEICFTICPRAWLLCTPHCSPAQELSHSFQVAA